MNPDFSPIRRPSKDNTTRIVVAVIIIGFGLVVICAIVRIIMVMTLVNSSSYREPVLVAHGVRDASNVDALDMVKTARIYLFMAPWPNPLPSVDNPKLTAAEQLTFPADTPEMALQRVKAEAGDMASASKLGRIYYNGEGGVPMNFNEAFKWFKLAANQGDAYSEDKIGEIYRDGYIVKEDDSEALAHFHKAAALGLPDAINNIAWMTFYGQGTAKDEREANRLAEQALPGLEKGADAGDPECMADLGDAYVYGIGVTTDDARGMSYYQKAADLGSAYGQDGLGSIYEGGLGVPVNIATALDWYRKAAAHGQPDAQIAVTQLTAKPPP